MTFKMPEPTLWTLGFELDLRKTTCRGHLWFSNPQNTSWAPLFTADQLKAAYRQGQESAYDAMFDAKGCKACRFDAQTSIRALIEKEQQS